MVLGPWTIVSIVDLVVPLREREHFLEIFKIQVDDSTLLWVADDILIRLPFLGFTTLFNFVYFLSLYS